jgi:hypothetical protein
MANTGCQGQKDPIPGRRCVRSRCARFNPRCTLQHSLKHAEFTHLKIYAATKRRLCSIRGPWLMAEMGDLQATLRAVARAHCIRLDTHLTRHLDLP